MSETISGKMEEITIKRGQSKSGKDYVLYGVKVNNTKYGTGFDKVKAAVGDTVEFEADENERGYLEVVEGTFRVTKKATPAESAAAKASNTATAMSTNQSIENQVALKAAVKFVGQFSMEGDEALAFAAKAYKQFAALLHPTSTGETAAPKKAAAKPKPVAAEDENADDQPDY